MLGGDRIRCRSAFALFRERCAEWTPERAERVAWTDPAALRRAAALLAERGPVCHASWSGVNQGRNATQTARAISCLYALTGDFDAPGGNVFFRGAPQEVPFGRRLLPPEQRAKTIGLAERPLGPAADGGVSVPDLWTSILDGSPYRTRALVSFGMNPLASHANARRGAEALRRLEFHVHADLYETPTARFADLLLPACTPWERESLRMGFAVDEEAFRTVQWRPRMVEPRGESRSDLDIVLGLAAELGLSEELGGRTAEELYERRLAPSGVTLDELRRAPGHRVTVPGETTFRKYALPGEDGAPRGFGTPTRRAELYSTEMLDLGQDPLPAHEAPGYEPSDGFPLVLTCAKLPQFCQSQHRALPTLRRAVRHPSVALHPAAAAARGIAADEWVEIVTPHGRIRARARLDGHLDERVACSDFGWWQACEELGEPGYDALAADGTSANYALLVGSDRRDPVSGSVPLRQAVCEIAPL